MKAIRNFFALLALCLTLPAMAAVTSTVTSINVRYDGVTYVALAYSGGHTSCGTSLPTLWAIKDETTVAGKAQLATLTLAYISGNSVTIYGLNTCTRISTIEDIDTVTAQ